MKKILTFLLILAAGIVLADDEVLLWMLDNPAVNNHGTQTSVSEYPNINAAGIRATGGNGDTVYLTFYDATVEGNWVQLGDRVGVVGGEVSSLYAQLADGVSWSDYNFAVELGNWENGKWTVLATGEETSYASLQAHLAPMHHPEAIPELAWNGGAYAVPEPSGGILTLMGLALLALRRKTSAVVD